MSITSLPILFVFLPLSLAVYYLSGKKAREYVLLAVSLVFYCLCSPQYLILFILAVIATVIIARLISRAKRKSKKKTLLILGILLNSSLLVFYKFYGIGIKLITGFVSDQPETVSLVLPLGISFFTFKAISLLTDVYKGTVSLSPNPVHDALYLSFFSQVQAGPITRYGDLTGFEAFDRKVFTDSLFRLLSGFCKKILIADVLSKVTIEIFSATPENLSLSYAWLGSICFSLQLLFDFSGYSDMAVGISGLFGYRCMENFDYPYTTDSVSRFWRKWHISLGQWFRDYVYIPLGGSKNKNKWRVYLNLLAVWLLTGIWHGCTLNFVVWGLGYFVFISFERLTGLPGKIGNKFGKALYRVITLLFINFQWVIFNSKDLVSGLSLIRSMIVYSPNELADLRTLFLLRNYGFFILIAIVLCFPVVPWLNKKLKAKKNMHAIYKVIIALAVIFAFIWSLSFVAVGINNPFAYGNF